MGIFDIEETEKRQLGICIYCGKPMIGEFGVNTGNLKTEPSVRLKDGTFLCDECVESKGLYFADISKKTKDEVIKMFKTKGFVSPDVFTATKRVHRVGAPLTGRSNFMYLEVDSERRLLNVPFYKQGLMNDEIRDYVIPWDAITDFNVIDNGAVISNLEILARGNVFQNRPLEGFCSSLSLVIITKEKNACVNFIGKGLDYDKLDRIRDGEYHTISYAMRECLEIIKVILADKLEDKKNKINATEDKMKVDSEEMFKVGIKQCPNCKTKYSDSLKFCSVCGALLEGCEGDNADYDVKAVKTVAAPNMSSPSAAEMHEWVLKTTFGGNGTKVTEIKALGPQISIDQYKRYIIKWAQKKDTFDVRDIVRLERTKKLSGNSVLGLLFGALTLLAGIGAGNTYLILIAVVVLLIDILTLHEKIIIIHHRQGRVKMPDDRVHNSDIEDFINFIRKYNPSAVKTFIE